jgi:hypothetical protein
MDTCDEVEVKVPVDMIYTDVLDPAASQLEQELLQSVSARAIVKAVVQQINAALSRALQITCLYRNYLLWWDLPSTIAKMGWQLLRAMEFL